MLRTGLNELELKLKMKLKLCQSLPQQKTRTVVPAFSRSVVQVFLAHHTSSVN